MYIFFSAAVAHGPHGAHAHTCAVSPCAFEDSSVTKAHKYIVAMLAEQIPCESPAKKQGQKRPQDFDEVEKVFKSVQAVSRKLKKIQCE